MILEVVQNCRRMEGERNLIINTSHHHHQGQRTELTRPYLLEFKSKIFVSNLMLLPCCRNIWPTRCCRGWPRLTSSSEELSLWCASMSSSRFPTSWLYSDSCRLQQRRDKLKIHLWAPPRSSTADCNQTLAGWNKDNQGFRTIRELLQVPPQLTELRLLQAATEKRQA